MKKTIIACTFFPLLFLLAFFLQRAGNTQGSRLCLGDGAASLCLCIRHRGIGITCVLKTSFLEVVVETDYIFPCGNMALEAWILEGWRSLAAEIQVQLLKKLNKPKSAVLKRPETSQSIKQVLCRHSCCRSELQTDLGRAATVIHHWCEHWQGRQNGFLDKYYHILI